MGEPSSGGPRPEASALVVDDDPLLAELVDAWLEGHCTTTVVHSGTEALDVVDDRFDVVLLDRRMPDLTGDEVLLELRERGHTMPVLMVSAIQPDYDVLDLPFDDYVVKPMEHAEFVGTVEELLGRRNADEAVREYHAGVAKLALLEREKFPEELEADERYRSLREEVAALAREADTDLPVPAESGGQVTDAGADP